MKKKKTKTIPTDKIPFPEILHGATPSPWGTLQNKRITGKLGEDFPIAFSLNLPDIQNESTADYLSLIRLNFYRFLEKESKKTYGGVRFAALDWRTEKDLLSLFSTFGPFETRTETLAATLTLRDDGSIKNLALRKDKKEQ